MLATRSCARRRVGWRRPGPCDVPERSAEAAAHVLAGGREVREVRDAWRLVAGGVGALRLKNSRPRSVHLRTHQAAVLP